MAKISLAEALTEKLLFQGFYEVLVDNAAFLELTAFKIGGIALLFGALYLSRSVTIRKKSLLAIIHESGEVPQDMRKSLVRFLTIFVVLIAFFLLIFNLMLEWLALAVDAPLLMLGLFAYLFIVLRHRQRYSPESLIYKLSSIGSNMYGNFLRMFENKKQVLLGVSGILVLHLLTDLGIFIVAYTFPFKKNLLYLSQLGPGHLPLWNIYAQGSQGFTFAWAYIFNLIAMIILLAAPAFVWYRFFRHRKLIVPMWGITLFFVAIVTFSLAPAFSLAALDHPDFAGTDIRTGSVLEHNVLPLGWVIVVSLGFGAAAFLLARSYKRRVVALGSGLVILFLGWYIYLFFTSVAKFFIGTIQQLFIAGELLVGVYFLAFFAITILFYISGYLVFLVETFKEVKTV